MCLCWDERAILFANDASVFANILKLTGSDRNVELFEVESLERV